MISVIIPFKDSEPWLQRCIDSLICQKGDFEFIFVNDGSTDNGADIVKKYSTKRRKTYDSRFRLLENKNTPGVSGARNTGLDNANGEWITFLDADDEFLPEAYKAFNTALKTEANIHQINHMRYYTAKDKLVLKYYNQEGWYSVKDMPEVWFGVWNKLYKGEFVKDVRFDETLQYGEDGMFNLECFTKEKTFHNTAKHVVAVKHRFDNPESLSKSKKPEDIIRQVRRYEDFLMEQSDPDLRRFVCDELSRLWGSKSIKKTITE